MYINSLNEILQVEVSDFVEVSDSIEVSDSVEVSDFVEVSDSVEVEKLDSNDFFRSQLISLKSIYEYYILFFFSSLDFFKFLDHLEFQNLFLLLSQLGSREIVF